MDLFDPKDYIRDKHGEAIDSPLDKNVTQVGTEKFLALGEMAPVKPRGQSGMMISDLMPHLASIADDICLLRGMNADNPQHASATNQFHTGSFTEVRPSMGSWIIPVACTKDLDNRPGLAALLDRVESNGVRVVLVENATRLARDLMVSEVILQQLTNAGCKVIAADSGTDLSADTDDPTRRLIRQVLGAVAEFDRRVTVMKLRAARERKRSRGERCEGRKPFGTFPGELQTLARIKELRRKPPHGKRRSLQQVCDALNSEGRPTRSGKPWTKQVVNRIMGRG